MPNGLESQKRSVREPPQGFWASLRYIGPGFILSAALVGSGELIVTTALGAKAGYVLLWFILFSCG
ncbi:MAG: divalent metal cation transporter, partial [bacterium]